MCSYICSATAKPRFSEHGLIMTHVRHLHPLEHQCQRSRWLVRCCRCGRTAGRWWAECKHHLPSHIDGCPLLCLATSETVRQNSTFSELFLEKLWKASVKIHIFSLDIKYLHQNDASESEWALLPGMFTHTRNLFSWQKLPQCNRMTVTEQKHR